MKHFQGLVGGLLLAGLAAPALAQSVDKSAKGYYLYVAAESEDVVALTHFDPASAELRVLERIQVGYQPTEIEGPHGLTVAPDGAHWYLSMAHGLPNGRLYKYTTASNELVGMCELGLFPATMQISESTGLLYCANFDLHGKMQPSTISIVDPESMTEVARTVTGPMPHGSRISPDGMRHYSCSMMADQLFELDAVSFEVLRTLTLSTSDDPQAEAAAAAEHAKSTSAGPASSAHGAAEAQHTARAKPTWAFPHPAEDFVYVALNGAGQVVEVDTQTWSIVRRFKTAKGPYNVEVSRDGSRMLISYKGAQSIGIWDLPAGKELARIRTSRPVTHGVLISPDSRFGFVTNEAIGATQGTLDVVDLQSLRIVASVDIGLQAGGLAFWKLQ